MPKSNENLPPATLAAILDDARERGVTCRKAIAIAADASEEMVRRWESGQLPKLRPFKRMISRNNLLPLTVQQQMIDWFLRGTQWKATPVEEADRTVLDHNGDGIVDGRDVLAFQTAAVCKAGESLEALLGYIAEGKGNEAERAQVRSLVHEQIQKLQRGLDALDFDRPNRLRLTPA